MCGAAGLACRRPFRFFLRGLGRGNMSLRRRPDLLFLNLDGLRFILDCYRRGIVGGTVSVHWGLLTVEAPQPDRNVFVDRAGVRLLFRHAKFRQPVQNFVSLDFQLPCQLVDSNLLHR